MSDEVEYVLVRRRAKGRGYGLGGAKVHQADCSRLRPLTTRVRLTRDEAARYAQMPTVACTCIPDDLKR